MYDPVAERFLPDRYVEGTCPHCGYDARPRRPVRQLRPDARPDRADRPAQQAVGRHARAARDRALVPAAAQAAGHALGVARDPRGLAAARDQLGAARSSTAGCWTAPSPATSTGACRSPRSSTRSARASGSTSGSTPSSATCRPPSSGRSWPATPDAWKRLVARPRRGVLLLHRQGQRPVPRRVLAQLPRRHEPGRPRGRAVQPAHRRAGQPVRDVQGRQGVSTVARHRHAGAGVPGDLLRPTSCATRSRRTCPSRPTPTSPRPRWSGG